jgi:hypothetical protein
MSLPSIQTSIILAIETKRATVQSAEVLGRAALNCYFVVVLQVGPYTWQIGNDGNSEFLELVGRANTTQLQDLRGIVCATRNDDLSRCLSTSWDTGFRAAGPRAGFVQVLTIEKLNTRSSGWILRLIEGNFGDVAVHANIEWVLLTPVQVFGISNCHDDVTRPRALTIGG